MRCIRTLSSLILAVALWQPRAFATLQESNPPGPYQEKCSEIRVKGGSLYAKCQDKKGKAHSAWLSRYKKCTGEIVNNNGRLECANSHAAASKPAPSRVVTTQAAPTQPAQSQPAPAEAASTQAAPNQTRHNKKTQSAATQPPSSSTGPVQPAGPYTESCHNIQMKGTTLHAICKSNDGREMPTSLKDATRCAQGVTNLNGILNCAVSDVLPPGSYLGTCKDVRLQGTTLLASCKDAKDQWKTAELRESHKCSGDITNHDGKLQCAEIKKMERR